MRPDTVSKNGHVPPTCSRERLESFRVESRRRGCEDVHLLGGQGFVGPGFDPSRFVSSWCEGELLGKGVGDVVYGYVEREVENQEVVVG